MLTRPLPRNKLSPPAKGALLVFFGAAAISFGPLIIASIQTGATASAFYRMLFGGLALLAVALLRSEKPLLNLSAIVFAALAGAAFSGDLFFWHRSIRLAGPGLSTILANFQVFILAIAGVIFFKERLSARLFIAIALALLGLTLLIGFNFSGLPPSLTLGLIYGLVTACFLSVYILSLRQSRKISESLPLASNMALVSFSSAAILAGIMLLEGESFILISAHDAAALALYGIGCQAVGWLMVSAGLPHLTPGKAGLLLMAEPLFAFAWEIIFLQRQTSYLAYIGAFITIFAIYLCFYGQNKNK